MQECYTGMAERGPHQRHEHPKGRTSVTHDASQISASGEESAAAPQIETLAVGQLAANCYLLICPITRQAAIIDPGDEAERILGRVRALGVSVSHVLHTHGHFDATSRSALILTMPFWIARRPARSPRHLAIPSLRSAPRQRWHWTTGWRYRLARCACG